MKKLLLACAMAGVLVGQQFKFNLEHLEKKASNTVDLALPESMVQLGAAMLSAKDPDEAKAKKIVSGLQGIFIKSLEFRNDGEYTKADLDQIRAQLKAPEWQRMVGVASSGDRESTEVWVRSEGGKVTGLAILNAAPRELTVVNLVGTIDPAAITQMGGFMGIPKLKKK